MSTLKTYCSDTFAIRARGGDTEFSYRTPIETLLKSYAAEFGVDADVLHEPQRVKDIGAPDFRLDARGGGVLGYVECKKPTEDLQKLINKAQLEKYRALSANIILTDAFRWILLRDGKKIADVTLREKPTAQCTTEFADLLRTFLETSEEKVGDAKRLAEMLARRCTMLHKGLQAHAKDDPETSRLHGLLKEFQTALDTNLDFPNFADAFAQTLVYSLLLAKLQSPPEKLTINTIRTYIPENFAFIRDIAIFLQDLADTQYKDIKWIVADILAVINAMDAGAVAASMSYQNRANTNKFDDNDDPYIYFYENFLAAYNAKLRKSRGVYYTPPPVVKFIINAVDDVLDKEFKLSDGLADSKVTALDFAVGTGTFMLEMMRRVLENASPAKRDALTRGHILKNFYGFELLIAPYAIAHLKLSQFLKDHGAPLNEGERINVFLANTLEEIKKQIRLNLLPSLAEEAKRAEKIKKEPVLVITGNPPYSAVSQNNSPFIVNLINDYKKIDGNKFKESNPKQLQDDYVKFIRFAQWKMDNSPRGIVAVVTNHSFLNNLILRGMRNNLMKTFDAMYFLDLHGSTKRADTVPDGIKDENVFDIQQGVAVSILIKNPNLKNKGVFHSDLYGKRAQKYAALAELNLQTANYTKIEPVAPFYLFVPRDNAAAQKYGNYRSVKDIFIAYSTGIKSHRDHFAFAFSKDEMQLRINEMRDPATATATEKLRETYNLKNTRDWDLQTARNALQETYADKNLTTCAYRPFDSRWCYYGNETMELHRPEIMHHMLAGENLGLTTVRQTPSSGSWQHVQITEGLVECCSISNKSSEVNYLFPLYLYDETADEHKRENLKPEFRRWLDERYGEKCTPENILGCIYAILHSPSYRKTYGEFLRTDFPRIPFPDTITEFNRLAKLGNELIAAHLLKQNCGGDFAQLCGEGTSHKVEKITYHADSERLYFNPDEYLHPVPAAVFQFQIGGYQPLDKYLKSRKGRKLTLPEIDNLAKTAKAIAFTIAKMGEIDG